ncbi:MAG: OmpH family outer membrane protein [Gemmatimonadaceae bacterium]|nr:OmpH family outer membrane protein [Gemmatimonadaceae bacterium]
MYSLVRATALAFGLLASGSTFASAQSGLKFAYIDSRIVLDKAPGRAAAESTFQKEYDAAQVKIKKMQDTLQAMVAAYQKTGATLTPVTRELREKEIRDKQQSYENGAQLLEAQMQQRQGELVQPMMNQIREVLEAMRKEDGFAFIFDVGASSNVIVAADTSLNVTDKVVSRLKPLPAVAKSDSIRAGTGMKAVPAGVVPKKPTL